MRQGYIGLVKNLIENRDFTVTIDMTESAKIRVYVRSLVDGSYMWYSSSNDENDVATYAFAYYMQEASKWTYNHKYGSGGILDVLNGQSERPDYDNVREHIDDMSMADKLLIDYTEAMREVAVLTVNTAVEMSEIFDDNNDFWNYVECTIIMFDYMEAVQDEMIVGMIDFATGGYIDHADIDFVVDMGSLLYEVGSHSAEVLIGDDITDWAVGRSIGGWKYLLQAWYITDNGDDLFIITEDGEMKLNLDSLTDAEEYQNLRKVWMTYDLFGEKIPTTFELSDGLQATLIEVFDYYDISDFLRGDEE